MANNQDALRFLGFAFASADLLFELDERGLIAIALGATSKVTGVSNIALPQSSWRVLFEPADYGLFQAMIDSINGSGRKGPVRCQLRDVPGEPPRYANVFACRLPQLAPNISCALSLAADAAASPEQEGLMDRSAFEATAGALLAKAYDSDLDVELALVEVAGLAKVLKGLSAVDAASVVDNLSSVLRAEALGGAASQLCEGQFAVMRERLEGPDTLSARLKAAAAIAGVAVDPTAAAVQLSGGADPQTLRALRYTLDHALKAGVAGEDLDAVFRTGLDATLRQAAAFREMVKKRQFKIFYQPVIDLGSRGVQHYEALIRFPGEESPEPVIRMAEELDLIETLDLAVAEKAINTLLSHGREVRISVNVSGRSFLKPKFLDRLLALTAGDVRLKGRLLFEITESAALANLELADERIQRLRRDGFQVCIDDFGAGAASLSYLRNLIVDVVKIDGQYVRQIDGEGDGKGGRDGALVRHLTALCRELNVRTVAEMIETEATADLLKSFGVDMGQGFFFGQPLEQIPTAAPKPAARRKGAVDSWG